MCTIFLKMRRFQTPKSQLWREHGTPYQVPVYNQILSTSSGFDEDRRQYLSTQAELRLDIIARKCNISTHRRES